MLLQVEEPGGTLDIDQRLGAGHLLPLEDLAGAERPFELADELFHMGWLGTHEVQRGTASEDFDIAFVRGKEGDQAVG